MERLRYKEYPLRHRALAVLVAALGLGAVFLALVLLLGSCSGRLDGELRQDGSARLDFKVEVPSPIAAKLRKLGAGQTGGTVTARTSIFDAEAIRASIASRPYLSLIELAQPSPESIRGAILVQYLAAAASSPDLASSGAIAYNAGLDWAELRVRLARGESGAMKALLPGLDPGLLEALSPPALEDEESLSAAEYRTMLKSILGEKAMPAMEAAALSFSITAPGTVTSSEGGTLQGRTLTARIPLIDALVLEKPIEFRLRWKQ